MGDTPKPPAGSTLHPFYISDAESAETTILLVLCALCVSAVPSYPALAFLAEGCLYWVMSSCAKSAIIGAAPIRGPCIKSVPNRDAREGRTSFSLNGEKEWWIHV